MPNLFQPFMSLLLTLLFISGEIPRLTNGQAPGQGAWCIARPSTSEDSLMENISFACKVVDCSIIQPGGDCFHPPNLMNHASVVMNLYYQKLGRNYWNCDFKNSAAVVVTDPSYGNCNFKFAY